jgi:hypothetical protein
MWNSFVVFLQDVIELSIAAKLALMLYSFQQYPELSQFYSDRFLALKKHSKMIMKMKNSLINQDSDLNNLASHETISGQQFPKGNKILTIVL